MIFRTIQRVLLDESGATAIEYGLIASLISISAVAGFETVGDYVETLFTGVSDKVEVAFSNLNN
jgi:pilus assembly protein Flp/PilA